MFIGPLQSSFIIQPSICVSGHFYLSQADSFFFLLNFQNCLTPPAAATIFFGANDAAILGRTSERQHVPINEYKVNLLKIVQQMKVYYNPSISFSFASKIYCPLTSRSLNLVLFWSRCSFVLVTSISLMTVYCLLDPMLPKFLCCTQAVGTLYTYCRLVGQTSLVGLFYRSSSTLLSIISFFFLSLLLSSSFRATGIKIIY